ncbi:Integrase catalytic domain-containing protein, partial [Aphis craccivora]
RVEACQAKELQGLYSSMSAHVAALEALGQPVNSWDAWLITIILRKLDHATSHEWQVRRTNTELPKYSELQQFLSSRCVALESSETLRHTSDEDKRKPETNSSYLKGNAHNHPRKALYTTNHNVKCECCAGEHRIYACSKFKEMPVGSRVQKVREVKLCFNCFSNMHMADVCKSKYSCRVSTVNEEATTEKADNPNAKVLCAAQRVNHVFLATAIVSVLDRYGEKRPCRVVLDSGSQINFVSRKMARLLNLAREKVELPVTGIGANRTHSTACITIDVLSRIKEFQVALVCHVLPTIVDDLSPHADGKSDWNIPKELNSQLADPLFHSSGPIDMLIGGGVFFDILETRRIRLGTGSLCLQDTKFGWVI